MNCVGSIRASSGSRKLLATSQDRYLYCLLTAHTQMRVSSAAALQAYSPGYWPVPTTAGLELMTFCCATAAAVRTSMLAAGARPPSFKLPARRHICALKYHKHKCSKFAS